MDGYKHFGSGLLWVLPSPPVLALQVYGAASMGTGLLASTIGMFLLTCFARGKNRLRLILLAQVGLLMLQCLGQIGLFGFSFFDGWTAFWGCRATHMAFSLSANVATAVDACLFYEYFRIRYMLKHGNNERVNKFLRNLSFVVVAFAVAVSIALEGLSDGFIIVPSTYCLTQSITKSRRVRFIWLAVLVRMLVFPTAVGAFCAGTYLSCSSTNMCDTQRHKPLASLDCLIRVDMLISLPAFILAIGKLCFLYAGSGGGHLDAPLSSLSLRMCLYTIFTLPVQAIATALLLYWVWFLRIASVNSLGSCGQHLNHEAGRENFRKFLREEDSEENLLFWQAVADLKKLPTKRAQLACARRIYYVYIETGLINLSSGSTLKLKQTFWLTNVNFDEEDSLDSNTIVGVFDAAARQVLQLMRFDSYRRYVNSDLYKMFERQVLATCALSLKRNSVRASSTTSHGKTSASNLLRSRESGFMEASRNSPSGMKIRAQRSTQVLDRRALLLSMLSGKGSPSATPGAVSPRVVSRTSSERRVRQRSLSERSGSEMSFRTCSAAAATPSPSRGENHSEGFALPVSALSPTSAAHAAEITGLPGSRRKRDGLYLRRTESDMRSQTSARLSPEPVSVELHISHTLDIQPDTSSRADGRACIHRRRSSAQASASED